MHKRCSFFFGGRVCKTGHANWSNWSRPCWLHVDRLASTAIGISSMHSRANQSLHFFCWLVNGSKSPNPKDCVGTLHFAHAEHALHAVEKYNRGILEVSHLSSKSIVGYGGYGSSIRNLWWPTAVFCQQVADQCYGSIMTHHQHLKHSHAQTQQREGAILNAWASRFGGIHARDVWSQKQKGGMMKLCHIHIFQHSEIQLIEEERYPIFRDSWLHISRTWCFLLAEC